MSAILNREPGTSAQSEENQVSTFTTTQQNVFTVQQIQPQAIFAGAHIDKFEGCTFNINVFCGDQSKIARLNENWSLSDRGTNRHYLHCSCTLIWSLFINCCFNHKFFHWACMKKFDEVCTKLDFEQLFLSRLDWRPVTEESQLNAWARAGKQIKLFMFLFLCFLVWPYNKHLINRARSVCMGESWPRSLVQTSLRSVCTGDLGQDSPIQTSRSVNKS